VSSKFEQLPEWFGLVVTTRPEVDLKRQLRRLNPFKFAEDSEGNKADIRSYIEKRLDGRLAEGADFRTAVRTLLKKSAGKFLYVAKVMATLANHDGVTQQDIEELPEGMDFWYEKEMSRIFPDATEGNEDRTWAIAKGVLEVMVASAMADNAMPVTRRQIDLLLGCTSDDMARTWRSLINFVCPAGDGDGLIFGHKSIGDWLQRPLSEDDRFDTPFWVQPAHGHARLAAYWLMQLGTGCEEHVRQFLHRLLPDAPICQYQPPKEIEGIMGTAVYICTQHLCESVGPAPRSVPELENYGRLIQQCAVPVGVANEDNGMQPLHFASAGGHCDVASVLIEKGAPLDVANKVGQQPLHLASDRGHCDVALVLIEKGAPLDGAEEGGKQPLHLASVGGHCDVASVLIEKGAPLDVADKDGSTPAHLAAERGHEGVLRVLGETEQGRNSFEMKNNKGRTPADDAPWLLKNENADGAAAENA